MSKAQALALVGGISEGTICEHIEFVELLEAAEVVAKWVREILVGMEAKSVMSEAAKEQRWVLIEDLSKGLDKAD
jgi:hypothetical protein